MDFRARKVYGTFGKRAPGRLDKTKISSNEKPKREILVFQDSVYKRMQFILLSRT